MSHKSWDKDNKRMEKKMKHLEERLQLTRVTESRSGGTHNEVLTRCIRDHQSVEKRVKCSSLKQPVYSNFNVTEGWSPLVSSVLFFWHLRFPDSAVRGTDEEIWG